MKGLTAFLKRHGRFYTALALGLVAFAAARQNGFDAPLLLGGDVFYAVFLSLIGVMIARQKKSDLKQRAKSEDEGILIVLLITIATMGFFCEAVFTALNKKHGLEIVPLLLGGVG